MKSCFIFICQRGDLEIKSLLLLLSLLKNKISAKEIYIAIPDHSQLGMVPDESLIRYFESFHVNIHFFKNPLLDGGKATKVKDLLTNKFSAINLNTNAEHIVFLDTDIICLKSFDFVAKHNEVDFLAKQVDYANEKRWDELYSFAGINVPNLRIKCSVENAYLPPYFNSGVFSIRADFAERLSIEAIELFRRLDESQLMKNNAFYTEQVALTLAVHKLDLVYSFLGNEYNFPIRARKLKGLNPFLVHYHNPQALICKHTFYKNVLQLINENEVIKNKVVIDPEWNKYFGKNKIMSAISVRSKQLIKQIISKQMGGRFIRDKF